MRAGGQRRAKQRRLRSRQTAVRGFIIAGHHARLASTFCPALPVAARPRATFFFFYPPRPDRASGSVAGRASARHRPFADLTFDLLLGPSKKIIPPPGYMFLIRIDTSSTSVCWSLPYGTTWIRSAAAARLPFVLDWLFADASGPSSLWYVSILLPYLSSD
jgi:hypothetical protein